MLTDEDTAGLSGLALQSALGKVDAGVLACERCRGALELRIQEVMAAWSAVLEVCGPMLSPI